MHRLSWLLLLLLGFGLLWPWSEKTSLSSSSRPAITIQASAPGVPLQRGSPANLHAAAGTGPSSSGAAESIVTADDLSAPDLLARTTTLRESLARDHQTGKERPLLPFVDEFGIQRQYTAGLILVKFRDQQQVRALEVEPGSEPGARGMVAQRKDVEFSELNLLMERQFVPNDSRLSYQWHHSTIGSSDAWQVGFGTHRVKIAIVDYTFQMDHPDLVANAVPGWNLVAGKEISSAGNDWHSTQSAGVASAHIDNGLGVAGTANCQILPIHLRGEIREMYEAILWCAENGVRVVNISWDGCFSVTLNSGAEVLKQKNNGIVIMAGVNSRARLGYPNQPLLFAISGTDRHDLQQSSWGEHVDFAAPGWDIYSTTSSSGYISDSGTSFSAPLVAGIVGFMLSINPALGPEEIEKILRNTADDLGKPGRDDYYGHGRVHFGRAVREAVKSSPYFQIRVKKGENQVLIQTEYYPGAAYVLRNAAGFPGSPWRQSSATVNIHDHVIEFGLPRQSVSDFFQLEIRIP